jgi:hypothetical protein
MQPSFYLCSRLLHKLLMINLPQLVAEIYYMNDSCILTPKRSLPQLTPFPQQEIEKLALFGIPKVAAKA